jgi:hypothetical protein
VTPPTVIVVSRRKGGTRPPEDGYTVDIARPTPLGNPFMVPRGYDVIADPKDILGRYRKWLLDKIAEPSSAQAVAIDRLVQLAKKKPFLALECWCAPLPCHGDVIRDIVLERARAPVAPSVPSRPALFTTTDLRGTTIEPAPTDPNRPRAKR